MSFFFVGQVRQKMRRINPSKGTPDKPVKKLRAGREEASHVNPDKKQRDAKGAKAAG